MPSLVHFSLVSGNGAASGSNGLSESLFFDVFPICLVDVKKNNLSIHTNIRNLLIHIWRDPSLCTGYNDPTAAQAPSLALTFTPQIHTS